jgi:hypothetical protein
MEIVPMSPPVNGPSLWGRSCLNRSGGGRSCALLATWGASGEKWSALARWARKPTVVSCSARSAIKGNGLYRDELCRVVEAIGS